MGCDQTNPAEEASHPWKSVLNLLNAMHADKKTMQGYVKSNEFRIRIQSL